MLISRGMIPIFPFRSQYAETHYKFRLPWSPLFRPWPEIFIDAPSLAVPGQTPPVYLVVKDADYFPVKIRSMQISLQFSGKILKQELDFDRSMEENLSFTPLSINWPDQPGLFKVNARIRVENARGKSREFLNANLPGLTAPPLHILRLEAALPYPSGWYAGEMHCHSDYSNDPVEYGAPLQVLQEAGASLGLGFVCVTDHSYDFYYNRRRYMERVDPEANFQAYRQAALRLNARKEALAPTLIPGEEVSCGNHLGENVHLLVPGHAEFIPGLGDGGRRWLNNRPDLEISDVLNRLDSLPGFAAHPRVRVGLLEKLIFRRGRWHEKDLEDSELGHRIGGLQFWNGSRGRDFSEGRAFWVQQLLRGRHLLPIAANDAHGDLNRNTGVKIPLVSLYQGRNHVFGKVRTVVRADNNSISGIQKGFREGEITCTDGPFLNLKLEENTLKLYGKTISEFSKFSKIHLFGARSGDKRESVLNSWEPGTFEFAEAIPLPSSLIYARAEAWTESRKLAITAAVFPGSTRGV